MHYQKPNEIVSRLWIFSYLVSFYKCISSSVTFDANKDMVIDLLQVTPPSLLRINIAGSCTVFCCIHLSCELLPAAKRKNLMLIGQSHKKSFSRTTVGFAIVFFSPRNIAKVMFWRLIWVMSYCLGFYTSKEETQQLFPMWDLDWNFAK